MNKLILAPLIMALAVSPTLSAKPHHHGKSNWARVTGVEPIIRTIEQRVPTEECWNEQVAYEEYADSGHSYTGTILGGVIGGAIGNKIGHNKTNKKVGTVVGAVLGASVGHDLSHQGYAHSSPTISYQNQRHCAVSYETHYTEEVIGYHVWYRYRGTEYKTRMNEHPGKKIKVRVNVDPY